MRTPYSPNFFSNFDETSRDYAMVVSDELIIGQIAASGSQTIFFMDKGSNFKFGMATVLGELYESFKFGVTILDI